MQYSIETRPTDAQWAAWWAAMDAEDLPYSFNDDFPLSLADFRAQPWDTKLFVVGDEVAGCSWLHDIDMTDAGMLYAGWLAGYMLPAHRGIGSVACFALAYAAWTFRGLQHLCAAVHVRNRRCHAFMAHGTPLYHVMRCPTPTTFGGAHGEIDVYATVGAEEIARAHIEARHAALQ